MNHALVLGASGGMGYSIVHELAGRGIKVTAFARNREKMEKMFHGKPNVAIKPGNVFNREELIDAANDVDVIFHAINIPYSDWSGKLALITENILQAAKAVSAKLATVDNIYAYGRSNGTMVNEETSKNPHTKKGKIRLEMETKIKSSGIPYIIAHFPDFYGPYAENAQINYTLRNVLANKKADFIGDQQIAREHIYTPDGAKALVELALHENAYFQNWNIPAYDVITDFPNEKAHYGASPPPLGVG